MLVTLMTNSGIGMPIQIVISNFQLSVISLSFSWWLQMALRDPFVYLNSRYSNRNHVFSWPTISNGGQPGHIVWLILRFCWGWCELWFCFMTTQTLPAIQQTTFDRCNEPRLDHFPKLPWTIKEETLICTNLPPVETLILVFGRSTFSLGNS